MNWEDICDGCGGCCDIGQGIACPRLDTSTNRCTVYEKRFEVELCIKVLPENVEWLNKKGVLPDSCAYVTHMKGLAPEPKEFKLIPFTLADAEVQDKRIKERKRRLGK